MRLMHLTPHLRFGKNLADKGAAPGRYLSHQNTGRTYCSAGWPLSLPLKRFELETYKEVSRETFFTILNWKNAARCKNATIKTGIAPAPFGTMDKGH
jgi:hypothetical protein